MTLACKRKRCTTDKKHLQLRVTDAVTLVAVDHLAVV